MRYHNIDFFTGYNKKSVKVVEEEIYEDTENDLTYWRKEDIMAKFEKKKKLFEFRTVEEVNNTFDFLEKNIKNGELVYERIEYRLYLINFHYKHLKFLDNASKLTLKRLEKFYKMRTNY